MTSEAFIQSSALELLRRGHEVDIFGIGNAQPTGFAIDEKNFSEFKHSHATRTWSKSWGKRFVSLPITMSQAIAQHGLSAISRVGPKTYRRTLTDLTVWSQLATLPKRGDYDILHCQFATLAEFVVKHVRAGFLSGKIVSHFRGYDITEVVHDQGPQVYDHLWGSVDGFIANCEHFANRAKSIGCPADRLTVIGSGIDLQKFSFASPRAFDPKTDTLRCVMVGRLNERKGFKAGLGAIAKAKSQHGLSLDVEVIGDGEQRAELLERADRLGLSESVRFSGWRPHSYIAARLKESHFLLAPSQTTVSKAQDAPVNTLKEAIASGTIVVATDHGGIPELVIDGVTGFVGKEGDEASIAKAINRALEAESQWKSVAEQALKRVQDLYAIDRVTDKQVAFYRQIMNK